MILQYVVVVKDFNLYTVPLAFPNGLGSAASHYVLWATMAWLKDQQPAAVPVSLSSPLSNPHFPLHEKTVWQQPIR